MRIVADTNIVVSGLIWRGLPRQLLNVARSGKIRIVTSPALLAELVRVLGRDKFIVPFQRAELTVDSLLADYGALADCVTPSATPRVVPNDPDDDHVIACALAARADVVVSGDHHLLDLGDDYQGIAILNISDALKRMA